MNIQWCFMELGVAFKGVQCFELPQDKKGAKSFCSFYHLSNIHYWLIWSRFVFELRAAGWEFFLLIEWVGKSKCLWLISDLWGGCYRISSAAQISIQTFSREIFCEIWGVISSFFHAESTSLILFIPCIDRTDVCSHRNSVICLSIKSSCNGGRAVQHTVR